MKKDRKLLSRQARKKRRDYYDKSSAVTGADDEAKAQSSDNAADADSENSSERDNEDTSLSVKKKRKPLKKKKITKT